MKKPRYEDRQKRELFHLNVIGTQQQEGKHFKDNVE